MSSSVTLLPFDHPAAVRRDLARRVAALALVAVALSGWMVVLQHHSAASLQRAMNGTEHQPARAMQVAAPAEPFDIASASPRYTTTSSTPLLVTRTDDPASAHP